MAIEIVPARHPAPNANLDPVDRLDMALSKLRSIAEILREAARSGGTSDEAVSDTAWAMEHMIAEAQHFLELERKECAPRCNRLGNILADAAMLPDADMGVLVSMLRGMRNGMDMDPDSLRSASDADVRRLALGRKAA